MSCVPPCLVAWLCCAVLVLLGISSGGPPSLGDGRCVEFVVGGGWFVVMFTVVCVCG